MPDHVHLLLKPQPIQQCAPEVGRASEDDNSSRGANDPIRASRASIEPRWISLGEIVKSIKSVTARQINQLRQRKSGSIWMTDYYERSVRDQEDFRVKLQYLAKNPIKAGLVESAAAWDAGWVNEDARKMARG
jgi:REP element-mobilizing transposase RayT